MKMKNLAFGLIAITSISCPKTDIEWERFDPCIIKGKCDTDECKKLKKELQKDCKKKETDLA